MALAYSRHAAVGVHPAQGDTVQVAESLHVVVCIT
jgi:hypothetical protein